MYRKQILAQLKKQFAGVSERALGLIADKLAKKIDAEDQIETEIEKLAESPISIQDYADMLQREGDFRVSEAKKKGGSASSEEVKTGDNKGGDNEPKSEIDELKNMVKGLTDVVTMMVKKETTKSMTDKLAEALPEINPVLFKGRIPEKDEDFDAAVEDIRSTWEALGSPAYTPGAAAGATTAVKNTAAGKLAGLRKPVNGVTTNADEKKVDPAIKEFFDKEKAAKTPAAN